jgi:hypothetical protein
MADDTPITDAGLMHLHALTKLGKLSLKNTQVTEEGVKKLRDALPKCQITTADNRTPGGPAPATAAPSGQ